MMLILSPHLAIAQLVSDALEENQVELHALSCMYINDMLVRFIDAGHLGDEGLPTLVQLYGQAAASKGKQMVAAYQRLGDVALFMSGFFSGHVRATVNGLGYYVDMGRAAYGLLANIDKNTAFIELAARFTSVVKVLNSVSEMMGLSNATDDDILELFLMDSNSIELQRMMNKRFHAIIIGSRGCC
jgi:hypothetical protein